MVDSVCVLRDGGRVGVLDTSNTAPQVTFADSPVSSFGWMDMELDLYRFTMVRGIREVGRASMPTGLDGLR